MNQFNDLLTRLNNNQDFGFSLIRIFLGAALFVRGWTLVSNPDAIMALVSEDNLHMWYSYITIGHLLGGFCLTFGILARLAALFQIPILIGAVFISEKGLMMGGQSLELATLVLFLLILIFIFGSGPIAVSVYFKKREQKGETSGNADAAVTA